MKVLITGGAGFIGFHLARVLLSRGVKVDLLDNFGRAVRDADLDALSGHAQARIIECDLMDPSVPDTLDRDYDVMFHFAAIIGVAHVLQRPYEVLTHNVQLLANAIAAARRQSALGRLVFASTSEVYAGTLSSYGMEVPTPEDTPLVASELAQARSSYMLSKIYGEAMCQHAGIPFTIVRPHNAYGPRMGMSHVVPELLKRAYESADGARLGVYSASHKRTFCYIDDAVEMLLRIVETPAAEGATLNLGSTDSEVTIAEVAQAVIEVVGRKLAIDPMPDTPGSPARRAPDMRRAQDMLGYKSTVRLREGIERTFEWYRLKIFQGNGVTAR